MQSKLLDTNIPYYLKTLSKFHLDGTAGSKLLFAVGSEAISSPRSVAVDAVAVDAGGALGLISNDNINCCIAR